MTTTAADCAPGRFCPDHPVDPGLLVLIAATVVAVLLVVVAAVLVVVTVDAAVRRAHHRLTRTRHAAATYAAAITRVRAGHTRTPEGRCDLCFVTWPCPLLCRLAGPPCGPGCEDRHDTPPATPPRPHLDVMAAAVEDWWLTADPADPTPTGAAQVDMYLTSSGYTITPWPTTTPTPLARARARLRTRAR